MKRVLHTFDSRREAETELRRMSMKKPHARALHSLMRLIDGNTGHIFMDISGEVGLRRLQGLEVQEHVPHFRLDPEHNMMVRSRIRP